MTTDKHGLSRRKARELAMTILYQRAMGQEEPDLPDDELVVALDTAVREHAAAYDALIMPKLKNWTIDRLAVIDHIILQMAVAEMLHYRTAPRVVIDEAVDLAKKFSAPEAGGYINGILDAIMKDQGLDGK
ncbi:MAG TPA: transcription antitermination factor NusB [bacterium]|nr:transcription antitermination factor NusB [bacterium]